MYRYIDRHDVIHMIRADGFVECIIHVNNPETGKSFAEENPGIVLISELDYAKERKRDELKVYRDSIIDEGFAYGPHHFPLAQDVQLSLMQQFLGSQVMPAPSYSWKDVEGIYRPIGDSAAFQTFCASAMMYGQSLFAWEEMLQGLVNAAETVDEVRAVGWDTVPDNSVLTTTVRGDVA